MTGFRRLGVLNNRHLFLTVREAEKSKIKVPADLVPGEDTVPCLWMAPSYCVLPHMAQREREREREREGEGEREGEHAHSGVSSYEGTNPILGAYLHAFIKT